MTSLVLKIKVEFCRQDPLGYQSQVIADEELDLSRPEGWKRLDEILIQARKRYQEGSS